MRPEKTCPKKEARAYEMKQCTQCGLWKFVKDFRWQYYDDTVYPECKVCRNIWAREYYRKYYKIHGYEGRKKHYYNEKKRLLEAPKFLNKTIHLFQKNRARVRSFRAKIS
jgi:hypothetical protein